MQKEYRYLVKEGKATIIGYTGKEEEIVIPQYIDGFPVVKIGSAFHYSGVESVTIPEGVVSIGKESFLGSELKNIKIPASVAEIAADAFEACSLENITVDKDSPYFSSFEGNLYNKSGTVLLRYSEGGSKKCFKIPSGVVSIGEGAFRGCFEIRKIVIPDGVRYLERGAFSCCTSLKKIKISQSVVEIGAEAFLACDSLKFIELPKTIKFVGEKAFRTCFSLKKINIPIETTHIGEEAFWRCKSLKKITIPHCVAKIGRHAFEGCDLLKINCEVREKPSGWDADWNPDDCPVTWG